MHLNYTKLVSIIMFKRGGIDLNKRAWIGVLFLVFGIGVLLHQIDVWDFSYIVSKWWPVILIVFGIVQFNDRAHSSPVISLMFILVGGLFLVNQWIDVNLTAFIWPLILIFIGLTIIFSRVQYDKPLDSNHAIESFVLFSGTNIRSQSKNFQGGNVTAVFGGSEINLRDTVISDKGATFDLTAIFGGITIEVPENVHIEISGLPIFGGWEDKTRKIVNSDDDPPVIKLHCLAICGGVEIKN